ncbi:MAG: hypothetical protein KKE73_13110 [Proteobacteria bacterium]|nr:hypothetical protein [Pseudomonadota bacterium]
MRLSMDRKKSGKYTREEALALVARTGMSDGFARAWALALHDGFLLRIPGVMSLRDMLTEYVGLDNAYLEERIKAIFLDGKPVDDIDAAPVACGNELSLSGAMPGVAGITMGRNNPIAVYREGITFHCGGDCDEGAGLISVWLFNFIAKEAAPEFLALGVGLDQRAWQRVCADPAPGFWEPVARATLDGREIAPGDLTSLPAPAPGTLRWLVIS